MGETRWGGSQPRGWGETGKINDSRRAPSLPGPTRSSRGHVPRSLAWLTTLSSPITTIICLRASSSLPLQQSKTLILNCHSELSYLIRPNKINKKYNKSFQHTCYSDDRHKSKQIARHRSTNKQFSGTDKCAVARSLASCWGRSVACKTYNVICRSLSEIWVIVWPRRYATLPCHRDANAMHSPILLLCHASVLRNTGFWMPDVIGHMTHSDAAIISRFTTKFLLHLTRHFQRTKNIFQSSPQS